MINPENLEVVKQYENSHIHVYSFTKNGKCPNCFRILKINQFGNWICSFCYGNYLMGNPKYKGEED